MDRSVNVSVGEKRAWTLVKLREGVVVPSIEIVEEEEAKHYETGSKLREEIEEVIVIETTASFTDIAWRVAVRGKWRLRSRKVYDRVSGERELDA